MVNQGGLIYKTLVIGILILFIDMSIVPSADTVVEKELQTELIIGGPTLGEIGITYEYIFFLFDHEGNDFYLYVVWGDGSNTGWMGPFATDEEVYASHVWEECGYYTIFAVGRCEDYYCNASLTVAITDGNYLLDENFSGTFPPEGWSTDWWTQCNSSCGSSEPPCALLHRGDFNNAYITSKAVDASNYEKVILRFRFGAWGHHYSVYFRVRVNETSPWKVYTFWDNPIEDDLLPIIYEIKINLEPGGCADAFQVNWTITGYYYDFQDACLDEVIIYNPPPNNPPSNNSPIPPTIGGPKKGKPSIDYNYTFITIDPDGDDISYYIEWGDGTSTGWTDYFPSETMITINHSWNKIDLYPIRCKAKDIYGVESGWSDFPIEISRNKAFDFNFNLLERLFERFPLLVVIILRAMNLLR